MTSLLGAKAKTASGGVTQLVSLSEKHVEIRIVTVLQTCRDHFEPAQDRFLKEIYFKCLLHTKRTPPVMKRVHQIAQY